MPVDPTFQELRLDGWGPDTGAVLPGSVTSWLGHRLGPLPRRGTPVPALPLAAAPSRLPTEAHTELVRLLGADQVRTGDGDRLLRAAGKSYLDLLVMRSGGTVEAPDAVLLPGTADDVAAVLRLAADRQLAVVPFGGGTSVVGGLASCSRRGEPVLSLDLRRLTGLLAVDHTDLTATFRAGTRGVAAEAALRRVGLTLGHFPQSYEFASLGGYAATRSAGQNSTGFGRFDEMVLGVVLQSPSGELRLGRGAATAAGPSLIQLVLGSEGTLGVITEVTLRVRRLPAVTRYQAVLFRSWADGCSALRELAQDGTAPDIARLSDPEETRAQLVLSGHATARGAARLAARSVRLRSGCLAVLGWEAGAGSVHARRAAARRVLRAAGAVPLGARLAERWRSGRFAAPYLRDQLLDAGLLVETLETSAKWSRLAATDRAVRAALDHTLSRGDAPPLVLCHVSHLYPQGGSLYFTVLCARDTADPVGQWRRAKQAATEALVREGATITHHHAVGTDHLPYLADEVGPLGVRSLWAVKDALDPAGIMNPGKLLPPEGR